MLFGRTRSQISLGMIAIALLACSTIAAAQDDTAKIQSLLNRGGAVKIPAGVHTVGPLSVPPTVTSISGVAADRGSTLKLKDNAGPWARVLAIKPSSDTDSAISISNLTVDMNRDQQGWQGKHDLEHQGAILLEADKKKRGMLKARIRQLTVNNSAGDGIYVYHRAQLDLADYNATDVFRGAIGITGKQCSVVAKNCKLVHAGIDVEPNSDGDTVDVTLNDIECSKFDVALSKNSKFKATNITASDILYLYCHPEAEFVCRDSSFTGRYKIRLPGKSTFERCTFTGPPGNKGQVIGVQWAHNSLKTGMTLRLIECQINGPGEWAIHTAVDAPQNGNLLRLENCRIQGTKEAIHADKKGNWEIERSTFDGKPMK